MPSARRGPARCVGLDPRRIPPGIVVVGAVGRRGRVLSEPRGLAEPLTAPTVWQTLCRLLGVVEERAIRLGIVCGQVLPSAEEIAEAERLLRAARSALHSALGGAIPPELRVIPPSEIGR